jgi:hypothetical protein
MEKNSEDTWTKILNNQKKTLIGTNEPNNGNGYHDGISVQLPFNPKQGFDKDFYLTPFYSVYLRNLGLLINPGLGDKFEKGLKITNCTENYYNTMLKYLANDVYYYRERNFFHKLGEWGNSFSQEGRLIFEIIGWYSNESSQFYGFQLNQLDVKYCKIRKNDIVYNAPYELVGDKEKFLKVQIPKNKCIIINFPKELGGYKGFIQKVKRIKKLGSHLSFSLNPEKGLAYMKNWDSQFNRIVSNWGDSNTIENVSDFYQVLSFFKFRYLVVLCTHELINGLKQLIDYLNVKFNESAIVEFNIREYDKNYFKDMFNKWMCGKLSFKEANDFLNSKG